MISLNLKLFEVVYIVTRLCLRKAKLRGRLHYRLLSLILMEMDKTI